MTLQNLILNKVFEEVPWFLGKRKNKKNWHYSHEGGLKKLDNKGPTSRYEIGTNQPQEVQKEEEDIYAPTTDYYKKTYDSDKMEIIRLMIGVRGTITK